MFDWQESRFGETAEPDPLSFGSPQQAQHAQQGQQAQHAQQGQQSQRAQQAQQSEQGMGAMSDRFQVHAVSQMSALLPLLVSLPA